MSQPSLMVYNVLTGGCIKALYSTHQTPQLWFTRHGALTSWALSTKVRLPVVAGLWHLLGRHSTCLKNRILHVDKLSQHTNVTVYLVPTLSLQHPVWFQTAPKQGEISLLSRLQLPNSHQPEWHHYSVSLSKTKLSPINHILMASYMKNL